MRKIFYNKLDDIDIEPFEDEIIFIESEECRYIFKDNERQNYDDIVNGNDVMDEISGEYIKANNDGSLIVDSYNTFEKFIRSIKFNNKQIVYVEDINYYYCYNVITNEFDNIGFGTTSLKNMFVGCKTLTSINFTFNQYGNY